MAERIDPLPYIYDETNEKIVEISKLISDFCGITEENDKYPVDPTVLWPLIWQTLRLISSVTCWDDAPEDLFLTQTREQNYFVSLRCKCIRCKLCDDDFVIIPLEYIPLNGTDFWVNVKITGMINGKYTEQEIEPEYLATHYDKAKNQLYLEKTLFYDIIRENGDNCCRCEHKMNVVLEYNAGYDIVPKGLLPAICYILNKVNNGVDEEDCHDNLTQTSGLLRRKKVGNVEYEWSVSDTTNSKTATLYSDLHDLGMLDEVLAISRCYLATQQEELGDVV